MAEFRSGRRAENFETAPATARATSLFKGLAGHWAVARRIDDDSLGRGSFTGTAWFTHLRRGALHYEERGEMTLGHWRGPAWRRWVYSLEGDAITVRYPETLAELHVFRFSENTPDVIAARHTHSCGADRYEARMQSLSDGSLSLTYVVTGPAKNYRLNTLLTRT